MTFALDDRWVWDFWLARSADEYHLYYLSAPKSLGDEALRHRNATIGHAVSTDLMRWTDHGRVLGPGAPGAFDETATWTGSVVQAPDGVWWMFYTGARFHDASGATNVETVGVATSTDLHNWHKADHPVIAADPRWYERLGDATWREEAWRDPWVFFDPAGGRWHMLLTARRRGAGEDGGVIGHAVSADLRTWEAREPLSAPGAGFAHLEVPQLAVVDGRSVLLFSCDSGHLAGRRRADGESGGIWAVAAEPPTASFDTAAAVRVTGDEYYSGKVVEDPAGRTVLLAFRNVGDAGGFVGELSDPMPLSWSPDGLLTAGVAVR